MNQAAQTARRSPEFAADYAAIAKRRAKKIATITVARKLLTRAWHLLSRCSRGGRLLWWKALAPPDTKSS
jgi:hypothetical protein